ncbi:MAG TPA: peptidylprolyl isomerase [Thermoleophilaceae bacterium]
MTWPCRVGPAAAAFVLVAALLGACGGEEDHRRDPAAARVGDHVISERTVGRSIDLLFPHQGGYVRAFGPPGYTACRRAKRSVAIGDPARQLSAEEIRTQCKLEFGITRAQTVSYLVRAEWLRREARRRALRVGAMPTSTQVTSLRARSDAREHALLRTVDVGDAEIARYARGNSDVYGDPEQRLVRIVQTTSAQRARAARAAVDGGRGWERAVARYGVRPLSRSWNGTHTVRANTAPNDAFGQRMFSSPPGQLEGPVKTRDGWFVFQVVKILNKGSERLSPRSRKTILDAIRAQRLSHALEARYAPQTRCAKRYRIAEVPECR